MSTKLRQHSQTFAYLVPLTMLSRATTRLVHSAAPIWRSCAGGICAGLVSAAIAVAAASPSPASAGAITAWKRDYAARIVVEFEGGVLGESMAEVISRIAQVSEIPEAMPLRSYTIKPKDTDLCSILNAELMIPRHACSGSLVNAIRKLSYGRTGTVGFDPSILKPGARILLPDIHGEVFNFYRNYDTTSEKDRRQLEMVQNNQAWRKILENETLINRSGSPEPQSATGASGSKNVPTVHSIEFEGYRWTILIKHEKLIPALEFTAFQLSNWNRSVIVERAKSDYKKRRYTYNPSQFYEQCINGLAKPVDRGVYERYLNSEKYAQSAIRCDTASSVIPEVFVIDTPVASLPDIADSLESSGASSDHHVIPVTGGANQCGEFGQYHEERDHGTYLAGIIAAAGHHNGYVGINPNVKIRSIIWNENVSESELLRELRNKPIGAAQIFLFTSEFPPFPFDPRLRDPSQPVTEDLEAMGKIWQKTSRGWTTELKNNKVRWANSLNKLIANNKLLFIVAAGQAEPEPESLTGAPLRRVSPASPQNIGDTPNVLVVTACSDCDASQAKIWSKANYSTHQEQIVNIAAPGGEMIPGLTSDNKIGKPVGGTSAAAAFTAGVAAKMLECYPRHYSAFPGTLKEWLMLTARPNIGPDDMSKAQAGTLSPQLALIDPESSWLKIPQEQSMREIKVKHWCHNLIALQDDNREIIEGGVLEMSRIRRVIGTREGKLIGKQLKYDTDMNTTANVPDALKITVKGPGRPPSRTQAVALLEMAEDRECVLNVGSFQDLILDKHVSEYGSCENIPPCRN